MPIACLLVPSLALAAALVERPALAGQPVALADEAGLRADEVTPQAAGRGVRPGMSLREAVGYCPLLVVLEPRPAHTRRCADQLLEALETVSPLLEETAPGIAYADLRGLEGLYPDAAAIDAAVRAALPEQLRTLRPRLGVAERRFTATVAARSAAPGELREVPAAEAAAFLAELPAGWLPLDREALRRLRLLGIETVQAFAALPRHAVAAQFGPAGGVAWLAARGEDPTPLRPQPFARERVRERAQAEPPLVSREAVTRTVEQLLGRALQQPRARGRFVRLLRLRAVTEGDGLWERRHTMKEPTASRERLWTAIRPLLEQAEYSGPIVELELELSGLTAESGRQPGLLRDHTRERERLDEMVRHLKVRYRHSPVARVVEVEPWSRIPERRRALMDYDP